MVATALKLTGPGEGSIDATAVYVAIVGAMVVLIAMIQLVFLKK